MEQLTLKKIQDRSIQEYASSLGRTSYYRSMVCVPQLSVNSLVAAAAPLLSINKRLQASAHFDDINQLHQQLIHELNSFITNAQNHSYRAETILIARYMLCALLDETIVNTSWGASSHWSQQRLLSTFQGENNADEGYFYILERISKDPEQHLDLLELSYLCLNLGFEGKYRFENNGKIKILEILDELYQLIRLYKKEPQPFLTAFAPKPVVGPPVKAPPSFASLVLKNTLITVLAITGLFLIFNTLLWVVTTPVDKELTQLIKNPKSPLTPLFQRGERTISPL